MTVRDIEQHLARTLGTELSHDTISKITDAVLEEVQGLADPAAGRGLPDHVPRRAGGEGPRRAPGRNKAAHIAVGVDMDGVKHVLGIWVQSTEGAKFWAGVCAELANRGVRDVLIACCDGLTGLPEAIEATWPHTIGADLRGAPDPRLDAVRVLRRTARSVAAALRPIYTAADVEAAETALLEFAESDLGRRYPATVAAWERAWERFIPFLAFPPAVRKIIYTTNSIESLNYQLRKIIKNRGHFPNDDAVIKLLWLAIRDIEDKRARARDKEARKAGRKPTHRPRPARRRRHHPRLEAALNALVPGLPRPAPRGRAVTAGVVYECGECGERTQQRRCQDSTSSPESSAPEGRAQDATSPSSSPNYSTNSKINRCPHTQET